VARSEVWGPRALAQPRVHRSATLALGVAIGANATIFGLVDVRYTATFFSSSIGEIDHANAP
jgi:hypothetical protein